MLTITLMQFAISAWYGSTLVNLYRAYNIVVAGILWLISAIVLGFVYAIEKMLITNGNLYEKNVIGLLCLSYAFLIIEFYSTRWLHKQDHSDRQVAIIEQLSFFSAVIIPAVVGVGIHCCRV